MTVQALLLAALVVTQSPVDDHHAGHVDHLGTVQFATACSATPQPVFTHALALAATAPPTDKTYANQLEAGAILERLFAAHPDHPGLAHYIIHAYDVPPLASRALDAARRYSEIAPSAPHALHMPSHTFTRAGAWQRPIDAN